MGWINMVVLNLYGQYLKRVKIKLQNILQSLETFSWNGRSWTKILFLIFLDLGYSIDMYYWYEIIIPKGMYSLL